MAGLPFLGLFVVVYVFYFVGGYPTSYLLGLRSEPEKGLQGCMLDVQAEQQTAPLTNRTVILFGPPSGITPIGSMYGIFTNIYPINDPVL